MVDPLLYVSGLLVASVLALVLVVRRYQDKLSDLRAELKRSQSSKQSLATTYGRITEQWAPFLADYPYDPQKFRFLGSPVDGVQFEEDRIVFVEFKTNSSRLSPGQERIRRLVEERRVEWLEFRVGSDGRAPSSAATSAPAGAATPVRPAFTETGARVDERR